MEISKLYTLWYTPTNNHGCLGEMVIVSSTSERTGLIIETQRCTSCWQTGCDIENDQRFRDDYLNKKVTLPECLNWDVAIEYDSTTESTRVSPANLIIEESL